MKHHCSFKIWVALDFKINKNVFKWSFSSKNLCFCCHGCYYYLHNISNHLRCKLHVISWSLCHFSNGFCVELLDKTWWQRHLEHSSQLAGHCVMGRHAMGMQLPSNDAYLLKKRTLLSTFFANFHLLWDADICTLLGYSILVCLTQLSSIDIKYILRL